MEEGEGGTHTWTLHDGILARPLSPPATPSNLAAVVVPTIADRLGASTFILELTYMNICHNAVNKHRSYRILKGRNILIDHTFFRASSSLSARSQALSTAAHSESESGWPAVVVAVTMTLMITAAGNIPVRFTLDGSCGLRVMRLKNEVLRKWKLVRTSWLANARTERMNMEGSTTSCSSSGNLAA